MNIHSKMDCILISHSTHKYNMVLDEPTVLYVDDQAKNLKLFAASFRNDYSLLPIWVMTFLLSVFLRFRL